MRRVRLYWLVAFAALAAGASACAALAGLGQYAEFDGDGGGSHSGASSGGTGSDASSGGVTDDMADVTSSDDANEDVSTPEEAGDDATRRDAGDGGADGGNDGSGLTDAPAVVEAGDDAGDDASDGGVDASDGGCAHPVVHANGVGGGYLSCAPASSFGLDEAQKACTSSGHGACSTQMIICGLNDTETFECAAGGVGACVCWSYQQPNAGHVRVSTLSPGLCQCAVPADPAWGY